VGAFEMGAAMARTEVDVEDDWWEMYAAAERVRSCGDYC